jgi:hypothetical protein
VIVNSDDSLNETKRRISIRPMRDSYHVPHKYRKLIVSHIMSTFPWSNGLWNSSNHANAVTKDLFSKFSQVANICSPQNTYGYTVRPRYYAPLYYADICYTRFFLRKLVPPTIFAYFDMFMFISKHLYYCGGY